MALQITKPGEFGRTVNYWVIDRLSFDKASYRTDIYLAGWETRDVRETYFPQAQARAQVQVTGPVDGLSGAYVAVKAHDDWSGAIDA